MPVTVPDGPTAVANPSVVVPHPQPTSRMRSPVAGANRASTDRPSGSSMASSAG